VLILFLAIEDGVFISPIEPVWELASIESLELELELEQKQELKSTIQFYTFIHR
jgi:hypothetical protein